MRTFGTATLVDGRWKLEVEPHVAMRLKRCFAKIKQSAARTLYLSASEENCRDLAWFCERYPLLVHPCATLEARSLAFDARAARVAEILSGAHQVTLAPLALPPREYQRQAAILTLNNGHLLLADELGLGKTISAITVIADPRTRPALVVTMAHLTRQWARELVRFLPTLKVHVAKRGTAYPLADKEGIEPDVVVMNYHKLSGWADHLAGKVRLVVFDECQELRHEGTAKYNSAAMVAHDAVFRMGLSATPIYNYGPEFHSVFSVLAPDALGSSFEFLREWCAGGGLLQDPRAFGAYMRETGLMLRRTRAEVGRELPSLNRIVHEVDLDSLPLQRLKGSAIDLAKIIVSKVGKGIDRLQASQEFSMIMRQQTGIAKAPYVAHFVKMLLEQEEERVVLFGWHRAVYEIWLEYLSAYSPELYTGTESPTQKQRAFDRFVSGECRVLIISLRAGAGLDGLQGVCNRVVIGELDWSPAVLEQCIGRIHRDGQTDPVMAYYLVADDGADPVMTDVLGLKRGQIEGAVDPYGQSAEIREIAPDHVQRLAADYLRRHGAHFDGGGVEELRNVG